MKRRLTALIIGISNYPNGGALANATHDAVDMATALEALEFSVILKTDCTVEDIDRAIQNFKDNLNSNDVGLFYFAGHGIQIKGENYLITTDTNFSDEISVKHTSFALNRLIEVMDNCSNPTNLIILDACRNNPFVRAWNRGPELSGLASVYTPKGTLIAFATSPGEVAADGPNRNGSYTEALLKHINTVDISVEDLFKRVRNTLSVSTTNKQTSWEHTSLSGDFFFNISAGRRLTIYSAAAIADSTFIPPPGQPLTECIRDLKSSNWYTQNPAIAKLTKQKLESTDTSTLFVLGRNIYQAACGSANDATSFIVDFHSKTADLSPENRKAILDGMLFEVFFNSKGEIRETFKTSKFDQLFELQKIESLAPSFELISDLLITYQNRFYVLPGKSRQTNIDIKSKQLDSGENLITGIFFEGSNIITTALNKKHDETTAHPIRYENLVKMITTQMMIPKSQLTITSDFDKTSNILIPFGTDLAK
ncbi:caspase family protein [Pseudomonas syringae]|uniref:caspase family protein n=1 Tax=Pseudomonas syringae TaxID=317 RepID=UPI000737A852|nr:caspase family protein [Pseudomonas syringae]KTB79742.1 hypothetical protein AO070_20530 [Pseudomonas syringae pv. syringae PD2766]